MVVIGAAEIGAILLLRNIIYAGEYQEYLNGSPKYNDENMKNFFIPLTKVWIVGVGMLGMAYSYMMADDYNS